MRKVKNWANKRDGGVVEDVGSSEKIGVRNEEVSSGKSGGKSGAGPTTTRSIRFSINKPSQLANVNAQSRAQEENAGEEAQGESADEEDGDINKDKNR